MKVQAGPDRPERALPDAVARERETLLEHLHGALDGVMVVLSLFWIGLLIVELTNGPLSSGLEFAVALIWAIFVLDFLLEFAIAPVKRTYLRTHWLTVLSLVLPALRLVRLLSALRILRMGRVLRSAALLRVLTSINRGLVSLRMTAARRGIGYLLGATVLVMAVGSAGMASFESPQALAADGIADGRPLEGFGDALWWTASAMTTGATHEPATAEGRILGWLLSLFGLGVFGYLTATLASHFIERDSRRSGPGMEGSGADTRI